MKKRCATLIIMILSVFMLAGCESSSSIYNCHLIQNSELKDVFDKASGKTTNYYITIKTDGNKELSAKIDYAYYNELTQYKKSKDFEGAKIVLDCIYDSGTESFTGVTIHKEKDK